MKFKLEGNKIILIAIFIAIIAAAIFVRAYNFNDWLYFKMDQSRDAILIKNIVDNGPGYLPLLGARAGAVDLEQGFLRLGPIFYYFQYASALIFHSTQPYVFAYPDFLFSILAIPILYLLVRLYFSREHSLMIMAMYAFSFIIIQYSRFAWNPNSLQFFLLLAFYGLLKFLNEKDKKKSRWWLALWAIGIVVGSQLHFFGFFSLIGISGLMIFFHRKLWRKNNIKECFKKHMLKKIIASVGIVFSIVAIFYVPVVISESKNKLQNTKNFLEALSAKPENKPFVEKIQKDITENVKYYCLITTSQCYESSSKKEIPAIIITVLILLFGFILAARSLKRETNQQKVDFLTLFFVWFAVFTILTIPVSFQLRPRFFIVVFAIPFIALGFIFEYLQQKLKHKYAFLLAILATTGIIIWNSYGTYEWFKEQAKSQEDNFSVKRTLILKAKDGITLGQLQRATDWIYARHKQGKNLYYYIKPEHVRPIEYLLKNKNDTNLIFSNMKINGDPHAQFFAITPAKGGLSPVTKKFGMDINVLASEKLGQIAVYEIDFPNRVTSDTFKFKKNKTKEDRLYWKDVF
jgi:hypothetical protein